MSQELKSSSEQLPTASLYVCSQCEEPILDHVYQVQRRRIRPVVSVSEGGDGQHDAIDTWHNGVQLGPEFDDYCLSCYDKLPDIQELLNDYHKSLNPRSS